MKNMFTAVSIMVAAISAHAAVSRAQWSEAAAAMRDLPGVVRFYRFDSTNAVQPDLAGSGSGMTFSSARKQEVTVVGGCVDGTEAVFLDDASFRASLLTELKRDFTVSIWFKPEGAGSRQEQGRTCGMVCSSGSGYYDGWRVAIHDLDGMLPTFEIGCGKSSVGLRSGIPLNRGSWNHLAASWDGRNMTIFVNGMPAGTRELTETAQPAKAGFAVGFSGYGVGSLKMAVSEIAVFNRALSAGEITAISLAHPALEDKALIAVNEAHSLWRDDDFKGASDKLAEIAGGPFPPQLRVWAEATVLFQEPAAARTQEHAAAVCRLLENPLLPVHLKNAVLSTIFRACKNKIPGIPSRVLERLPQEMELSDEDKFICAAALADSYMAEGQQQKAFAVLDHLVAVYANDGARSRELHFSCAHYLRTAGKAPEASQHYLSLANSPDQPGHVRAIAALSLARTYLEQGKYDEAIGACDTIRSSEIILPHHKYEAGEIVRECENLKAGRAARDPEAFRRRPDPLPLPAVVFFVSPEGSDSNPGTRRKPFATPDKARDAIRELKRSGQGLPPGGVAVYLRGGIYRTDAPFELAEQDSGSQGAPVVYCAYQDEKPVFDGGFEVGGFRKVRDPALLSRLPEEARGKVYAADLKAQGFTDFERQQGYGYGVNNETIRSVYADGEFLEISRWPNQSRIPMDSLSEENDRSFRTDCGRLARWTDAEDLMVDGFWYHLWAGEALHVERVDPVKGTLTLEKRPGRGLREGRPFHVMNLLEEIDRPGEWYIDRKQGVLYIWLKRHPWFTDVVVSQRRQPFIRAEGLRDVVFKGIQFRYGQERAALFSKCVNLSIIGCRFHGFGGTALSVVDAANAVIYGNKLDTLGHGGMHVSGGNRKNLASGGIRIENNEVGHFGLCSKTYVPAILLEGVGATVAHNWFHHAPSSAMRIEGNDHLVEYNLTEFVVRESDDQGGIDMWGNPSYRGCVMRYNIWRDIGAGEIPCGQAGIRFDDAISGMVVYGNIFERSSNGHFGGVQIHGGHMNIVDNNLFIDCHHAVSFSPWNLQRFREFITEKAANKLYMEVNIDLPPYSVRYPTLKALRDEAKHNVNSVWRNVIAGTGSPWYRPPPGTDFCDNHFIGSYSPDSDKVRHSTFSPIPVAEIGLYTDPACAWDNSGR